MTGKEAGGAYEKLAEVQTKLDAKHEAASACVEAAKCYQKTDRAGKKEGVSSTLQAAPDQTPLFFFHATHSHVFSFLPLLKTSSAPCTPPSATTPTSAA